MCERYIACLNAGAWNEFGKFVATDVVHNGRSPGIEGYQAMLEENYLDIADLHFDADLLVANESHVASRLRSDCTPVQEFFGVPSLHLA
jgi:predicted ester cyclase